MKLIRLTLENFRTHKHYIFEPSEQGITAIRGVNGKGKSSLLEGLSWALYGTSAKPANVVSNSSLIRRGANIGKNKDNCFVEAEIEVHGEVYRIRRTIVNNRGTLEASIQNLDGGKWSLIASGSVKDVDPEIRRIVGLTVDEYFTAVHIRQSHVNDLVDKSDKQKRSQTFYKLMGITSITEAINLNNDSLREVKKAVSSSTYNGVLLDEYKNTLRQEEESLESIVDTYQVFVQKVASLKEDVRQAEKEHEEVSQRFQKQQLAQQAIDNLKPQILDIKNQVEEWTQARNDIKRKIDDVDNGSVNANIVIKKFEETQAKVNEASGLVTSAREMVKPIMADIKKLKEDIANGNFDDLDKAQKEVRSLESLLEAREKEQENISQEASSVKSTIASLHKALDVLSESKPCPTCLQTIDDSRSKEVALTSLNNSILEQEKHLDDLRDGYRVAKEHIQTARKSLEKALESVSLINTLQEKTNRLETLVADGKKYKADYELLCVQLKAQESLYENARQLKNLQDALEQHRQDIMSANHRLSEKEKLLAQAQEDMKQLGALVDESKVERKYKKKNSARELLDNTREKLMNNERKKIELESSIKMLSHSISIEESNKNSYERDSQKMEKLKASLETLQEFKANRIAQSIPIIESYASRLLTQFTHGDFEGVVLDDSFMATVVRGDGEEFSVNDLSGGERQAVAIALRIATSMLMTGDVEFLLCDEITTSLDSKRTPLVLQSIAETIDGQVIIIDHKDDEVDAVVDKIVEL